MAKVLDEDDRLEIASARGRASASLWWTRVPPWPGEKLGVVGRFEASDREVAIELLERARFRLIAAGCTLAIGPMDGNTWRSYRFVSDAGREPPFFLEPSNPEAWPRWWSEAGFAPVAEYTSTITEDLAHQDNRIESASRRLERAGVTLRPLLVEEFDRELARIHTVSLAAFRHNFLYTPISTEAFVGQYQPLRERVQPELVLLAEAAGEPVGYVFGVPDFAQAQRGEPVTQFIVKTLAVLPGRAFAGLGAVLLARVHEHGRQLGYRRVIHALMHESNSSRNLSAHYARTIRRYTLYKARLATALLA